VKFDGFTDDDISEIKTPNYVNLQKIALKYADAFVKTEDTLEEITSFASDKNLPMKDLCEREAYKENYPDFYKALLDE